MRNNMKLNGQDHDLLIEIKTKVDRVINDVSNLSSNLVSKVEALAIGKADKEEFKRCTDNCIEKTNNLHERIERLENWRWYLVGIGTVVIFVIDFIIRKVYQ
jgi:ribosomal silencing factor RsfS